MFSFRLTRASTIPDTVINIQVIPLTTKSIFAIILYKKNAYRVLLTRARQGMIVFVPHGDNEDYSRNNLFYDGTFDILKKIGFKEI